jgi:hypothetical protein
MLIPKKGIEINNILPTQTVVGFFLACLEKISQRKLAGRSACSYSTELPGFGDGAKP